jgi:hypothetical protein
MIKNKKETTKKHKLAGFNSVESCPNCNPCNCPQDKEKCRQKINRHAFLNGHEFTDQALLEELVIRIKMGCVVIKEKIRGYYLPVEDKKEPTYNYLHYYKMADECRRDLGRDLKKDEKTGKLVEDKKAPKPFVLDFGKLVEIQKEYRKLEDEDKLCNICLYKPLDGNSGVPSIFCEDC